MSFVLQDSVGIGGGNVTADVERVQDALNRVPQVEGGPTKSLKVDGLCGPLTKGAIYRFQLHQFGWKGADALVEVELQTHQRLRHFQQPPQTKKEEPPAPPVITEPRAQRFVITSPHKKTSIGADPSDFFFEIRSVPHHFGARYWLGRHPQLMPGLIPKTFLGNFAIFETARPMKTREFVVDAVYVTRERGEDLESELTLFLEPEALRIRMTAHLMGPGGMVKALPRGKRTGVSTSRSGRLFLVGG